MLAMHLIQAGVAIADARSVARFMIFDSDNPNSILVCLRHARDNANGMRDRITSEANVENRSPEVDADPFVAEESPRFQLDASGDFELPDFLR